MPTPVRVVIVGCGWFACVAHIPALKRLDGEGRIKLVGLILSFDTTDYIGDMMNWTQI
jgi:predicted dehydrogenase